MPFFNVQNKCSMYVKRAFFALKQCNSNLYSVKLHHLYGELYIFLINLRIVLRTCILHIRTFVCILGERALFIKNKLGDGVFYVEIIKWEINSSNRYSPS